MYDNRSQDLIPAGLLSSGQFTVITCVLTASGVLGFAINSVTLSVFITAPALRCPTNLFIMAVLCCDLIMSTVGIPFAAVASAYNRWIFGTVGCSFYGFLMSFLGYSSIYLLTAISVERYLLITNPLSRPLITNPRAIGVIFGCVTLALLLAGFPLVGWSSYALEAALVSCSVNWQSNSPPDVSYIVTVFVLGLLLPVGIMVYAYFNVFLMVRSLARNELWGKDSHVTRRNIKIEFRATRNILFVIGAFLLSWTPYATVSLWSAFGNPRDISPLAGTLPAIIAKSSVVWNPLVYVLTNEQFRTRVGALCPFLKTRQGKDDFQDEANSDDKLEMNLLNKNQAKKDRRSSQNNRSVVPCVQSFNANNGQYLCVDRICDTSCASSLVSFATDSPGALTPD